MFTAQAGSGGARSALRIALFSLAVAMAGCSANPANGALEVEVVLEAGLISRCVKVTATDGVISRESKAIALSGKMSPLRVAVFADGLSQPVTVQALGYSDEGCTTLQAGEVSQTAEGNFTSPTSTVTVTLRRNVNGVDGGGGDGGMDAGVDAGTDAGFDAGIDLDQDGSPLPDDCDDNNASIRPGATELCTNAIDDDCDLLTDCQEPSCANAVCAGGGTCIGGVCVAMTESVCNDGLDNNNNGLVDCADPDCPLSAICSDNNSCTTGDRCVADGGCEKVADTSCTMPPNAQCYGATGMCMPDAGATCRYTPTMSGSSCNDGLGCTDTDSCSNGTCAGTPKTCNTPGNTCLQATGSCQEPSGTCTYAPVAAGTGTCSDGQNCTINDSCAGDGGCAGTAVTCTPPSQCHTASTGCDAVGTCLFNARTGLACDAGTGAGTCDGTFNCNATPTSIFATPPSNFAENQLPDAGTSITVSCATTLNTSGTPAITNGACVTMPPSSTITQTTGGEPAVLIRLTSLTVNSGQVLTIDGSRPVIFAVTGNVQINGTIRATNAGSPIPCGNGGGGGSPGGGGGGFGTAGAVGGSSNGNPGGTIGAANGAATLIPLRGGCSGGNGGTGGTGGAGGGSIQIVATGTISISATGTISAPGRGGLGGTGSNAGGGGGGSGGAILLEAPTITVTGAAKLTANGGGGGGGEDGGNVGGNGGTGSETAATGGAGGTATSTAGTGGAGGGAAAPVAGTNDDNDGAGGGGGAVGRIRINAGACTVTSGEVVSPAATGTTCT